MFFINLSYFFNFVNYSREYRMPFTEYRLVATLSPASQELSRMESLVLIHMLPRQSFLSKKHGET